MWQLGEEVSRMKGAVMRYINAIDTCQINCWIVAIVTCKVTSLL